MKSQIGFFESNVSTANNMGLGKQVDSRDDHIAQKGRFKSPPIKGAIQPEVVNQPSLGNDKAIDHVSIGL